MRCSAPGILPYAIRNMLASLCLPVLLWQPHAVAEPVDARPSAELSATVEAALQTLDATVLDDDWSFTMAVLEEDELRIIHSDPSRDKYEKRLLISVNDIAADEARQEAFYDSEVERIDGLDPDAQGYSYMVDMETLRLLELSDDAANLGFVPRVKTLADADDKISGSLRVNLASGQIEQIEIFNTAEMSPAFSVTIDTYRMTLQFQPEQGENLLSKLESHATGKAGFVKRFDSLVSIAFSDYQRVAP